MGTREEITPSLLSLPPCISLSLTATLLPALGKYNDLVSELLENVKRLGKTLKKLQKGTISKVSALVHLLHKVTIYTDFRETS
jgi:hypothetical protein